MIDSEGLYDRIDHGWGGHSWASRDWQEIDCSAVACENNRNQKCLVPSRAVIGDDGRCRGFKPKGVGA